MNMVGIDKECKRRKKASAVRHQNWEQNITFMHTIWLFGFLPFFGFVLKKPFPPSLPPSLSPSLPHRTDQHTSRHI